MKLAHKTILNPFLNLPTILQIVLKKFSSLVDVLSPKLKLTPNILYAWLSAVNEVSLNKVLSSNSPSVWEKPTLYDCRNSRYEYFKINDHKLLKELEGVTKFFTIISNRKNIRFLVSQ